MSASQAVTGHNASVDRATAEIDLDAIAANIERLRAAAPESLLQAVVKADAYGHGIVPVARAARVAGADYLGVALPSEAMALRESGDTGPIMCWLYTPDEDLSACAAADIEISVSSISMLEQVVSAGQRSEVRVGIHLKLDSGLGRNGSTPQEWERLVREAKRQQDDGNVEIIGIWSHLACADEPESPATQQQLRLFCQGLATAADFDIQPRLRHLAATAGTLAFPESHFDMVRCGIGIYGLTPGGGLGSAADLGLVPAMTVRARVALTKVVDSGHGVSYGHTYRTSAQTRLALIPVGYGDGIPRAGSGSLPVDIRGKSYTAAGTIAMDQFVVDVGDDQIEAGDVVELFGAGSAGAATADEWAADSGTIGYEIVTRLGARIPRSYVGANS